MGTLYRYRRERRFPQPPEAIWPIVADTARLNEVAGTPPYRVEEKLDAEGRIRRIAIARLGPLAVRWEEGFGEWQENRRVVQRRDFRSGPFRRFEAVCELFPDGSGTRVVFSSEIECVGMLGLAARTLGLIAREGDKRVAAVERLIRDAARKEGAPGSSERDLLERPSRGRLEALARALDADPAAHGLGPKLIDFLMHAPAVSVRSIRPLAMARAWDAEPDAVVELFLAAQDRGLLAMGWDLLCPRCRGAKARVRQLHDLPKGAHCPSCNIDYERDFARNVELTFHPEPWVRSLPQGEFCLLGPGSTPHVKFQAEVAAGASASFDLSLPPGAWRFRTVEAGPFAEAELGADGMIPELQALEDAIVLRPPGRRRQLHIRNDAGRARYFVVEDRNWAKDALTGDRVIALPAFRRLCPEQLLRPGDDAEIGNVTIMFTDLKGSTQLYQTLGDACAYRLVRDHFAFLSERVERHRGIIVKTVGDAIMAAFHEPADAVAAALAIQDELPGFNQSRADAPIALKLGLHAGSCVAVTTADVLDYFGSTVNAASRLEHQCRGGEILLSQAVLADAAARRAIAGRPVIEDEMTLRGLARPIRFCRLGPRPGRDARTADPRVEHPVEGMAREIER
jgi:class 3 adenylate cyclase